MVNVLLHYITGVVTEKLNTRMEVSFNHNNHSNNNVIVFLNSEKLYGWRLLEVRFRGFCPKGVPSLRRFVLAHGLAPVQHGWRTPAFGGGAAAGASKLCQLLDGRLSEHGHFERFRKKMCSWLVLLDVVALHDLPFLVEAQVPAPARLLLPVVHRRVRHIVVLKHRFFEITLRREVFWCV